MLLPMAARRAVGFLIADRLLANAVVVILVADEHNGQNIAGGHRRER